MMNKQIKTTGVITAIVALVAAWALSACGGGGVGKTFALMDPGESQSSMQTYAQMAAVDGLAYRAMWSSLEPTAGQYNWTNLDNAFEVVKAANKKLTVHVGASSLGLPNWLVGLGATTYTYSTVQGSGTDALPWDPVFIDRYAQFVAAMGAHIKDKGYTTLLEAVSDGVPTSEMTVRGCEHNALQDGTVYNRSAYLGAWQSTVNATFVAFPDSQIFVSAPLSFLCFDDKDGSAFYDEVMNFGIGLKAKVTIFAADLKATGSARLSNVSSKTLEAAEVGMQTIWSATNDPQNRMKGTLTSAVCQGWTSGARYFEIYKADLSNTDTDIQNAIASTRDGKLCTKAGQATQP